MMKKANEQQLQELFGMNVKLEQQDDGYVARVSDNLTIGAPFNLPLSDDGSLVDPALELTPENLQKVQKVLRLPDAVQSLELFPGHFENGIFWLMSPGGLPTSLLVSLYYQPDVESREEICASIAAFLGSQSPLRSHYKAKDGGLAQSQHIIRTPMSLWDIVHPREGASSVGGALRALFGLGRNPATVLDASYLVAAPEPAGYTAESQATGCI